MLAWTVEICILPQFWTGGCKLKHSCCRTLQLVAGPQRSDAKGLMLVSCRHVYFAELCRSECWSPALAIGNPCLYQGLLPACLREERVTRVLCKLLPSDSARLLQTRRLYHLSLTEVDQGMLSRAICLLSCRNGRRAVSVLWDRGTTPYTPPAGLWKGYRLEKALWHGCTSASFGSSADAGPSQCVISINLIASFAGLVLWIAVISARLPSEFR